MWGKRCVKKLRTNFFDLNLGKGRRLGHALSQRVPVPPQNNGMQIVPYRGDRQAAAAAAAAAARERQQGRWSGSGLGSESRQRSTSRGGRQRD